MDNEEQMMAEFRKIYREFYGEEIEDLDARGLAQNLLNAYRIVHRQPPQNEVDKSIWLLSQNGKIRVLIHA